MRPEPGMGSDPKVVRCGAPGPIGFGHDPEDKVYVTGTRNAERFARIAQRMEWLPAHGPQPRSRLFVLPDANVQVSKYLWATSAWPPWRLPPIHDVLEERFVLLCPDDSAHQPQYPVPRKD